MKLNQKTLLVAAAMVMATMADAAFAQGFAGGGGGGGGGFIAQIVNLAVNYIILPGIDIAIFYHAVTLMMGGHRMTALFEGALGILLITMHSQIVAMVPV